MITDYFTIINTKKLNYNKFKAMLFYMNNYCSNEESKNLQSYFNNYIKTKNYFLTTEDFKTAYKFLLKSHLHKKGYIKKNSPFKKDENLIILENIEKIEVINIYNAFTPYKNFYTPIYQASNNKNEHFNYFVFNNQIQITNND